jgi:hypothetical protein
MHAPVTKPSSQPHTTLAVGQPPALPKNNHACWSVSAGNLATSPVPGTVSRMLEWEETYSHTAHPVAGIVSHAPMMRLSQQCTCHKTVLHIVWLIHGEWPAKPLLEMAICTECSSRRWLHVQLLLTQLLGTSAACQTMHTLHADQKTTSAPRKHAT